MAKTKAQAKDLVVVESPAKARTVGRFLGSGYDVVASMGHVRDLPQHNLGVDVERGFEPTYVEVDGRESVLRDLRKAVRSAGTVYLATDPDREGEAISWHVVEALKLRDRKDLDLRRVVFHEITRPAVEEAFSHYRDIDMQLVNAQQARRVLDRIVGYRLSPVLWGKIRRGLSAGRVQSVALRLIVDREREIEAFKPVEYWSIQALLAKQADPSQEFTAHLQAIDGKTGRHLVKTGDEASTVVADLDASAFKVAKVNRREVKTRPAAPFTTSTLQQEAARRLRFGAQRTMRAAQQLYEGVALGGGEQVGLITYMRTDSTNLASTAVAEAGDFIKGRFGNDFFSRPRTYRTRSKNAQEAHEAIRPTSVLRTPEAVAAQLESSNVRNSRDLIALYDLIWKRMVASQMTDSVADATTVDIEAAGGPSGAAYTLRATGSVIKFQGFRAVYVEARDNADEDEADTARELVPLDEGETVDRKNVKSEQRFTQPPPRYSEAMLIRTLEENGIGRPSTFASIVDTIEKRDYVARDKGRFKPTKLGFAVNDFLLEWFPEIMDTGFTAGMEEKLDEVARGDTDWVPMLETFYGPFDGQVEAAKERAERVPRAELDEVSDETCEKCERPMVIKTGRYGKFLSCSGFPECRNSRPLRLTTGARCPEDGGELLERKARGPRGRRFYGCENYPKCEFSTRQRPLKDPCPECGGLLVARGRNGARCVSKEDYDGPAPSADEEQEGVAVAVEA